MEAGFPGKGSRAKGGCPLLESVDGRWELRRSALKVLEARLVEPRPNTVRCSRLVFSLICRPCEAKRLLWLVTAVAGMGRIGSARLRILFQGAGAGLSSVLAWHGYLRCCATLTLASDKGCPVVRGDLRRTRGKGGLESTLEPRRASPPFIEPTPENSRLLVPALRPGSAGQSPFGACCRSSRISMVSFPQRSMAL